MRTQEKQSPIGIGLIQNGIFRQEAFELFAFLPPLPVHPAEDMASVRVSKLVRWSRVTNDRMSGQMSFSFSSNLFGETGQAVPSSCA